MTDMLRRAWDVLEEGERPEGLHWWEIGKQFRLGAEFFVDDTITRDRLIVAVEDVTLREGFDLVWDQQQYCHWRLFATMEMFMHPDRLTAAVLALEAVRKKETT